MSGDVPVYDWLQAAVRRLQLAGVSSPALEAQLLAAHVLGVDRTWLFAHPGAAFPELAGEGLLQRREAHEPLAYILGWREFYGRRFEVNRAVLIPRQDTEVLVEAALDRLAPGSRVLDIGTGSGCIAVTLKLERPDVDVTASDISAEALEVAKRNAQDLDADIRLVQSDLFAGIERGAYDMIVTNPPYIGFDEPLDAEVREFEPHAALYGGLSGDEFYVRLAHEAGHYLSRTGVLLMEVGYQQALRITQLFAQAGWAVEAPITDLAGIERVLVCRR